MRASVDADFPPEYGGTHTALDGSQLPSCVTLPTTEIFYKALSDAHLSRWRAKQRPSEPTAKLKKKGKLTSPGVVVAYS